MIVNFLISVGLIIGIVAGVVVIGLASVLTVVLSKKQKKDNNNTSDEEVPSKVIKEVPQDEPTIIIQDKAEPEEQYFEEEEINKDVKLEDGKNLTILLKKEDTDGGEVIQVKDENGNILEYNYNRSFEAKLIQSNDDLKDYYQIIKNHIFSYPDVTSKVSWDQETFKSPSETLIVINIKRKILNVFFALNPEDFVGTNFVFEDVSTIKKYEKTPFRVIVNSFDDLRNACGLVDILMDMNDIEYSEVEKEEDYYVEYENDEPLLERKLIKLVKREGKPVFASTPVPEEPVQEEQPEEQPVEEPMVEVNEEAEDEKEEESVVSIVNAETGELEFFRYNRSFTSRLIQANEEVESRYERIKNHILSHKDVKNRVSWAHESFRKGRDTLVILAFKGRTLNVYLALDPQEFADSKYRFIDASNIKKFEDTPLRLKIKNNLNEKYALELIDILMEKKGLELSTEVTDSYHMDYETDEELLKKDLIR